MNIHTFTVGPFAENTYLVTESSKALLFDPGFAQESELRDMKGKMEEDGAELLAVVLTHAHVDHVLGLKMVRDTFDVPVYLSDEDRYLWNNFSSQAAMFGLSVESFDFDPEPLREQENWKLGPFSLRLLYTPGHAPDHIALYSPGEGILIAGDTLFKQGIGRTDLYKGSMEVLSRSIRNKLYTLPDSTTVYPGHGPKTTIGEEKKSNPFVRG